MYNYSKKCIIIQTVHNEEKKNESRKNIFEYSDDCGDDADAINYSCYDCRHRIFNNADFILESRMVRTEIVLNSVPDVKDLISDLKDALKRARRSGGIYYVYRQQKNHKMVIEIALPHRECV